MTWVNTSENDGKVFVMDRSTIIGSEVVEKRTVARGVWWFNSLGYGYWASAQSITLYMAQVVVLSAVILSSLKQWKLYVTKLV